MVIFARVSLLLVPLLGTLSHAIQVRSPNSTPLIIVPWMYIHSEESGGGREEAEKHVH